MTIARGAAEKNCLTEEPISVAPRGERQLVPKARAEYTAFGMASRMISLAPKSPWLVRWVLSSLLLLAGLFFSSMPVSRFFCWAEVPLHNDVLYLPFPTRFFLAAVIATTMTAALFLDWGTFREEARRIVTESTTSGAGWAVWLLLYVLAVAGLSRLVDPISRNGIVTASHVLSATILTLSAVATWCLAAMPARFWLRWAGRNPWLFPTVAAIGVLAYVVGAHYAPLVAGTLATLTDSLERSVLWMSFFGLRLFTKDVIFEPEHNLIGTHNFSVDIDRPCAGWEGIGLFCTLFGTYLWFYRRELRFPHVLALLPIGAVVLWYLNIIRIVALILLGNWSASIAIQGFHSVAGWLFFNAATLALVATSRRMRAFAKTDPSSGTSIHSNPASPFLVPLIAIILTAMIARMFFYDFDVLYPLRVLVGGGALWFYWRRISLRWRPSWAPVVLGVLAFVAWSILRRGPDAGGINASISAGLGSLSPGEAATWIMFRVAGAVMIAPIAEELAFRGYIIRKLVSAEFETVVPGRFTWVSFLGSSILFGALHAQWLAGTAVGMIFAFALYRRGSIADAMVSHGVANGVLAAQVLATRQWFLWG